MGVAKNGRRKIKIGHRRFLWFVRDDPDSANMILHVLSEDKQFIVNYEVDQQRTGKPPILIVIGKEFVGLDGARSGTWRRVECPAWVNDAIITPKFVRCLVEWAMSKKDVTEYVWCGKGLTKK